MVINISRLEKLSQDTYLFGLKGTQVLRTYKIGFEASRNGALTLYLWDRELWFVGCSNTYMYPFGFISWQKTLYLDPVSDEMIRGN